MKINWSKQPTPEHCWLEGIYQKKESGWYVLNGSSWIHETKGAWWAHREGEYFTVHRKPEEYVPGIGQWCFKTGIKFFYVGISADGKHLMQLENRQVTEHRHIIGFKPVPPKTEEELFIEKAVIATNGDQSDFTLRDLLSDMYQAGFKAPDKK